MTCNFRKLPDRMECPFDNLTYNIIDPLSKIANNLNTTPNIITSISVIFGILAIYYLYMNKFVYYAICFGIYYILDLLDGYYARKYDMCTKFGDYYDHIRDIFIFTTIITIICIRSFNKKIYIIIPIVLIFVLLCGLHMSCQELYTGENIDTSHPCHSHSLTTLSYCRSKKWISITRYFGMGTLFVIVVVLSYLSMKSGR